MDTTWLEDFLAVVDEGGFSRAAERRAVTQPAFSRRIRALEDWVGASLFDRSTHAVRLTPAGERFRPAAEELLRRLNLVQQETRSAAQVHLETLRLAATHVLSLTFFPAWLRTLEAETLSRSTVQLTADHMVACEKIMIEGRVQFLLCHDHPAATTRLTNAGFRSIQVGTDTLVPVAAPGWHPVAPGGFTPYLAYTSESGMGRILEATWAASGRAAPGEPAFSSHLANVLAAMARDGRGVAWAPLSIVADDVAAGRLKQVGTKADTVPMTIRLFRPKTRQAPVAEALWEAAARLAM